MRDTIFLSVGDTTIPFRQYEGDTAAYVRGLADAFRYLGIDMEVTEDVVGMVAEKPMQVQKAFLLRVVGWRITEIGRELGVQNCTVSKYIQGKCADIKAYLEHRTGAVPLERNDDI